MKTTAFNLIDPAWDTWSYKKVKPKAPTEAAIATTFRKSVQDTKDLESLRYLAHSIIDHLNLAKKQSDVFREEIAKLRAENEELRAELNEPEEDI